MLEEMDATHLTEWHAFELLQEEARKQAEAAARAESAVQNYRRGGR